MQQVAFQLWIEDLTAHLVGVQLDFLPPGADLSGNHQPITLQLPAWIPGSYLIRNFARHLAALNAHDQHGELTVTAIDKHSWHVQNRGKPITVRYHVYAFDLSVRACYVNDQVAVLNPAACCLSVQGLEHVPQRVTVRPVSAKPQWQLATGLQRLDNTALLGFGDYRANDYQQLIDSPLLMGELAHRSFEVVGITHHLVFAGAVLADLARIERDLLPICQQQAAVFGGLPADLNEYWFLNWIVDNGYGGLEHHNSTLLLCNRYDLPNPQLPTELTEDYQNYLALCSHEYFHTWWVKRAKPATFLNYQLDAEQYTSQLWLYEGFTSYYDDLALLRAGLIQLPQYLTTLSKTISRVNRAPSNSRQSLADSSFTAWTKFYQQDENAINSVVSYYGKGSLVALCLDAQLRAADLSLDGLMRQCWQQFGVSGLGSDEHEFFDQLRHYSQNDELVQQCKDWVHGTEPLPLEASLLILGITLQWRAAESNKDLSGPAQALQAVRDFGALYQANNEGLTISAVPLGSAAYQAGLMVGDVLIAIGGLKATEQNFQQLLQRLPLGESLQLHFFRQQRLLTTSLQLQAAPELIAWLQAAEETPQQQLWLATL
ncbi:M61 family peptidase [Rheinheimera riviphila]|uniref:M61 family peptidase n=1 Tax=Rheinheimera riviphila TaxID=1834037 RepID=A0A437QRF6_9GAMM|nr:PDZ domain-containing protein [Rheinheimera riviphila]RVU37082.1 M61 family peptidase [Rheinheimera riviphila]